MKALFVSQYADPNPVGANNLVYRQAAALKHKLDVNVEILTWPEGDHWAGSMPDVEKSALYSYLNCSYGGLNYHVVKLPKRLLERVLNDSAWKQAVNIGCELLKKINPSIVHLQHWRGLWWILESARRLSIPTVYSSYDWGIGCLKTILVKGEGGLCDGAVEIEKCVKCIWRGRNFIGKANELFVSNGVGERLLKVMDRAAAERWLSRHGAVRMGLHKRVALNRDRAKLVLANLSAIIAPNSFAISFFQQFGVSENRIHVEPWYYDLAVSADSNTDARARVALGYIGRISPEKGVKRIFEALLSDTILNPVHLVIAGEVKGEYAEQLHSKYCHSVGKHSVEWMDWIPHSEIHKFFEKVDATIISSEWMENTPGALIEAFAFKRPVICVDTPTTRDLVREGITGYLVTMGSTESLSQAISKLSLNPRILLELKKNIPTVKSSVAYASVIKGIYESIQAESLQQ